MDNIVTKASEHGDYEYQYDDLYRLLSSSGSSGGSIPNESYTYDQVGNRLTASGVTDEWSYNANNELQGYDDVSYEYDENGSITQKTDNGVITKFFYNIEGRLERVEDGSSNVIAEYYYDPFGRRLWKEVSGSTVFFQYADEGLVAEFDGTGTEIKTYGYKPGSTWSTDPLFMKVGSEYYFYHNDHLGTPQKMTAINGAVVWGAQYEAFGKASVDGGSSETNNLRFPGQYFDDETGLHYNFHRHYDPTSGRYFRVDPIGFYGSDINLYTYAVNDPINLTDPSGLMGCTEKLDENKSKSDDTQKPKRKKQKPSGDCEIMARQERLSKSMAGRLAKERICGEAFAVCTSNCRHAAADDECIENEDGELEEFDYENCMKDCKKSFDDCLKGKGFKHPDILKKKFHCDK